MHPNLSQGSVQDRASPRRRSTRFTTLCGAVIAIQISTLCALSLSSHPALCSPAIDTLGGLDQRHPFTAGVSPYGSSIGAFNPAGLVWSPIALSAGLTYVHQALSLTFDPRPAQANISEEIYQARPIDASTVMGGQTAYTPRPLPSARLPSRSLDERAYESAYLHLTLHRAFWRGRVHLGAYVLLPLIYFERQMPAYPDERAQYFNNQLTFERLGDRLEGLSSALSVATTVTSNLSVGVGLNLLTHSFAQSDVFLGGIGESEVSHVSPTVEVKSALSPFASIAYQWTQVRSFVSVHASEEVRTSGEGQVKIWNFPYAEGEDSIKQSFDQVYRALPLRLRLGLSWRSWGKRESSTQRGPNKTSRPEGLHLTSQIGWSQWSTYRDRAGSLAHWSDQWEASLGGSALRQWGSLGADIRWRPTPAPPQIGRSSYVDPHQLAAALHLDIQLTDTFALSLQAQAHRLLPRDDQKDQRTSDPVLDEFPLSTDRLSGARLSTSEGLQTNNPGYPGYQSEGWVWVTSLGLKITAPP